MAVEHRMNIRFVQEVEKYPCLYNFKLPDYVRKDLTELAWAKIGQKFGLSGSECKEKWKNLRSVFVRDLKQSKTGSTSLKKPYYLSEFMRFALPYIKKIKNKNACQETFSNKCLSSLEVILPNEAPSSHDISTQSSEELPSTSLSSAFEEIPVEFTSTSNQYVPNKELQKTKCEETKVDQVVATYFKLKQSKMVQNCNTEHSSNKMFLLSILTDMNKMNMKKRRVFKRRVLNLVDEILDEDSD